MKKLLLILLILGLNHFSSAQDTRIFKFEGSVTDKTDGSPLLGYFIDVYLGNDVIDSPDPDKKGRFVALLMNDDSYTIDIYMSGYYPKRVVVYAQVPKEIKKLPTLKFETELIRKSDYELIEAVAPLATSIFDLPYVIFEYDKEIEDFNYREAYTNHIKAKYEEVAEVH